MKHANGGGTDGNTLPPPGEAATLIVSCLLLIALIMGWSADFLRSGVETTA